MAQTSRITSPDGKQLDELCRELAAQADALDISGAWPAEQLDLCAKYGVHEWFVAEEHGGQGWSEADILRAYLKLSAACLTTTFILTQRNGALRRIAEGDSVDVKGRLLPDLISGRKFCTVAISHFTTSRRHLGRPAMQARVTDAGFLLDGFSAWVTGGCHAQSVVLGAVQDDGQQIMLALPTDRPGVSCAPPAQLIGLSSSHTGELRCDGVRVEREWLIAGPSENVMASAAGAKTGGLQTSTLAIGLAAAAIDFLARESEKRPDLLLPTGGLRAEQLELKTDLMALALGQGSCTHDELRGRANSLVLRATQAAITAAKGAGYVLGHPAGRWCREALFFLVWSCPQPVASAALCELAGLGG